MKQHAHHNWMGHIHMPNTHNLSMHINHMLHDDRFWAIVIIAALLITFIALATIASNMEATTPSTYPILPWY